MSKVACTDRRCGWHGLFTQTLESVNPFDPEQNIYACPKCKTVQEFTVCCDEPDCWERVCCGTPTPDGYRQTCHEHRPFKGDGQACKIN